MQLCKVEFGLRALQPQRRVKLSAGAWGDKALNLGGLARGQQQADVLFGDHPAADHLGNY